MDRSLSLGKPEFEIDGSDKAILELPDRLRLPLSFDVEDLRRDVKVMMNSDWVEHFVPNHYAGDWSVLPLRAPLGAVHPILQISANPDVRDWVNTPLLESSPALKSCLAALPQPLESARLMRLGPGSRIHEHRDAQLSVEEGTVRLHIPIFTNDRVDFRLNGRAVVMRPGELWYLQLSDPHSVANDGLTDRIHLVVDCTVGDEITELLARAAAAGSGRS